MGQNGTQVLELEPMLSEQVVAGLYAPDPGTVNPWQLGIAACENAVANGCTLMLNEKVLRIQKQDAGYLIETEGKQIYAGAIINCAGIYADRIHNLLFPPEVYLTPDGADYLVLAVGLLIVLGVSLFKYHSGKSVRDGLYETHSTLFYALMGMMLVAILVFGAYGIGFESSQFIYSHF